MTDASTTSPVGRLAHEDFSLVAGGPLYQLLLRAGLLQPSFDHQKRRLLVITAFAWVPLVVLSLIDGRALGGVRIPFVKDFDVQVRFLFSLPVFILAEKVVHERLRSYVRIFADSGLVRAEQRPRFESLVESTMRWRNSVVVEIGLVAFVYTAGHVLWAEQLAVHEHTWFATPMENGLRYSLAGSWFAWVSMPIFQFTLVRWWYRIVLWWVFLIRVSALDLHLIPTHPDQSGGLAFLGVCTAAFAPLIVAQTALVSAMIAGRILLQGAHLQEFKVEIGMSLAFALLQALGPLLAFAPKLVAARRLGLQEYGALANRYVREFDRKWLRGGAPEDEALVGSGDIQSLADLSGSFDIVRTMRPLPFGRQTVVELLVTAALPLLPLVTTVIPLEELVKKLFEAML